MEVKDRHFNFKFTFFPVGRTELNSGSLWNCTLSIQSTPLNNLIINCVEEPLETLVEFKVQIQIYTKIRHRLWLRNPISQTSG